MKEILNRDPGETLVVQPVFTHSNHMHRYEIGKVSKETMINFFIPRSYILAVLNGGPESLNWTAAIYNFTKKEVVSDYTKFQHGQKQMIVQIYENSIIEGDVLQLNINNVSGTGSLSLRGAVQP